MSDNITRRSYDAEEIAAMVNDCIERESKLTDWENTFIASCSELIDRGWMLSEKQVDIINRIWDRVT